MELRLIFQVLLACTTFTVFAIAQECLPDDDRIDCHPDNGATVERCLERGCTWCEASIPDRNTPTCFFPRNWGYIMTGGPVNTGHGFLVELERTTTSTLFGGDANQLTLEMDFQSDYRLRIRISDNQTRWEVPLQINPPATNLTDPLYDVTFENEPVFSFKVVRKSSGAAILDTSLGGFNFADQFIQIGYKIPSRDVYGIGENEQHSLRHSFENRPLFGLWARDQFPEENVHMYGVHPFYTALEDDGNAHAVVIINSNAQEFEMHPSPGIVYKTIGGLLDMYVFMGPTPESTSIQYTEPLTRGIDRQFFWGSGLLITPVLEEGATSVEAYFPDSRFYDYYTGEEVTTRGNYTVLAAPLDHINLHVHGGNIVPTQEPAVNTDLLRNNPFGLVVALDDNGEATGSMYFDDGESFDPIQTGNYFLAQLSAANNTCIYVAWRDEYPGMATKLVNTVRLLGVSAPPSTITVDGEPHSDFTVLPSGEVFVRNLNLQANVDFVLQYN